MTHAHEAASILLRTFDALAAVSGKRLSAKQRADIERACELLANGDRSELDDALETLDLPRNAETQRDEAQQWTDYEEWRSRRGRVR